MEEITGANLTSNKDKRIMLGFESSLNEFFELTSNVETVALTQLNSDKDKIFGEFVRTTMKICEKSFSSEEASGKYLDLNAQYLTFKSLKSVHEALDKEIVGPATAPLRGGSKVPQDYLAWLKCFHRIPEALDVSVKQNETYVQYLVDLSRYLTEYLRKSRPLDGLEDDARNLASRALPLEAEFEETFKEEWASGSLFAWEDTLKSINAQGSLYCWACERSFASEGVYKSHLLGKKHIKNAKKGNNDQGKLRMIAFLESWIMHLCSRADLLGSKLDATINQVRKKQSSSYDEIRADAQMAA